ncbi:MAG: aldo/keto reductase [Bacteroidia bacterium]|nr:aldo/keto reductase [Bacteroidia bacterium]
MYQKIISGVMSWGVWGKNLSQSEMIKQLQFCLDNDISTFDHADIYGGYTTEESFGKALNKSDINRTQIQLISKCGICYPNNDKNQFVSYNKNYKIKHYRYDKEYIINSVENSLRNLQTDYLDLLLLHRPSPLMDFDIIKEALYQLVKDGKIINHGVSNFTQSQLALANSKFQINANQLEFSLTSHLAMNNGILDFMQQQKITAMAWSPLGTYLSESNEQNNRISTIITPLAHKYNVEIDQLLLAWILKHPANIHPVIGTTNPERIKRAIESTKINLEIEDWFFLLIASQGHDVP